MATRIRRPQSAPLENTPLLPKKRKREKPSVPIEGKDVCRTTENEYIELSRSFQTVLNEKFEEINRLKRRTRDLEDKLEEATHGRHLLKQCYLRSISELATERLRGKRLEEFKRRSQRMLTDLHGFVVNDDVTQFEQYTVEENNNEESSETDSESDD